MAATDAALLNLPDVSTFDEFVKKCYPKIINGVGLSNQLPAGESYEKLNGNEKSRKVFEDAGAKVLDVVRKVLQHSNIDDKLSLKGINDILLGRVNDGIQLLDRSNESRPQDFFRDEIDNSEQPWTHKLTTKPNMIVPIPDSGHPYEAELNAWNPSSDRLMRVHIVMETSPIEDTQLIFVQTEKQFELMVADLLQQNEFAVNIETHTTRSYLGFTCAMEISTKENDYLVDTLKLRHKMDVLNIVFTKPNVLKIFHQAEYKLDALQRDFNLYVVNMFDTCVAARTLKYPKTSLSYLLETLCKVQQPKKLNFDWRTRPIPGKMRDQARFDTHYLIFVYQQLNNELFEKGDESIIAVYNKCTEICKKEYVKPNNDQENNHWPLYKRSKKKFNSQQLRVLKEVYNWRDRVAREKDESPEFILPNYSLMHLAQSMPRDVNHFFSLCSPKPSDAIVSASFIQKIINDSRQTDEPSDNESESESVEDSLSEEEEEVENHEDTSDEEWKLEESELSDESIEEVPVARVERVDRPPPIRVTNINTKQRFKPPYINIKDDITDMSFSPKEDLIVLSTVENILIYKYDLKFTYHLGQIDLKCDHVQFSHDGRHLFSGGVSGIYLSDVEAKKMIFEFEDIAVTSLTWMDENLVCYGDERGGIKMYDVRQKDIVFKNKPRDICDYVSSILYKESDYLSCTSGDGRLSIYDIRSYKIYSQSEQHTSSLTCSTLIRDGGEIVCGSETGEMIFYEWGGTAEPLEKYMLGPEKQIGCAVSVNDTIVVSGWDDGMVRATQMEKRFLNLDLGVLLENDKPVVKMDLSHDRSLIAFSFNSIKLKFWNVEYLRDQFHTETFKKRKI